MEDDLESLTKLMEQLTHMEDEVSQKVSVTVFSEYWQVEEHLNAGGREKFDFILLDRDCKIGGSFHVLDLGMFPSATVIGISSVPKYNQELRNKGINLIVEKDYDRLAEFASKVAAIIRQSI